MQSISQSTSKVISFDTVHGITGVSKSDIVLFLNTFYKSRLTSNIGRGDDKVTQKKKENTTPARESEKEKERERERAGGNRCAARKEALIPKNRLMRRCGGKDAFSR